MTSLRYISWAIGLLSIYSCGVPESHDVGLPDDTTSAPVFTTTPYPGAITPDSGVVAQAAVIPDRIFSHRDKLKELNAAAEKDSVRINELIPFGNAWVTIFYDCDFKGGSPVTAGEIKARMAFTNSLLSQLKQEGYTYVRLNTEHITIDTNNALFVNKDLVIKSYSTDGSEPAFEVCVIKKPDGQSDFAKKPEEELKKVPPLKPAN